MTSRKSIEEFMNEVADTIASYKEALIEQNRKLNDAADIIGCLQVENDDLKAQLKKYQDATL